LEKAQLKLSRVVTSDNLQQSSENNSKVEFNPFKSSWKIFFSSYPLRFLFFALQMLTNVPTAHMIVTPMPTVTIPWDPTYARANQHISGTENSAQASVSFSSVMFSMML